MNTGVPRLRMFAGPNGSGKTTVKNDLHKPDDWFGLYFNPDDLEVAVRTTGRLSLSQYGLTTTTDEVQAFFRSFPLLVKHRLDEIANVLEVRDGEIDFKGVPFNAYHASTSSAFLRRRAMAEGKSFSFETVMSDRDKIAALQEARKHGFRTYLYYIATEDPEINKQRVLNRVADGGHGVPEDKIVSRYHRSLELLPDAIRYSNRAFLFDTSEEEALWFAEITDGTKIRYQSPVNQSPVIPNWFAPLQDQFTIIQ